MKQPKIGDYVAASKYRDGCTKDHFAVGFLQTIDGDRYMVSDHNGLLIRANGFRRAQKISNARGAWLVERMNIMEFYGKSFWWWVRHEITNEDFNDQTLEAAKELRHIEGG